MANELWESTSALGTAFSAVAAALSGWCAYLSYRLSRSLHADLRSDERIICGVPFNPDLRERTHANRVIQCVLFNKSKRKAYVNSVRVFDEHGSEIAISWAGDIDLCGNPGPQGSLIGITDTGSLFVQRTDGERFAFTRIEFQHSFSETPETIIFAPYSDLK
jgi:hypothetical protein